MLVEKVIVPELSKLGRFTDLVANLKSDTGKYNRLWVVLLSKAEEAKIELSSRLSAEIDLGTIRDLKDDDGKTIDPVLTITRSEFESAIKSSVEATASMVNTILTRNSLRTSDLKFVLMVGGSTYIPYVRKRIEEMLGIPVNTAIDPTNAVAVGAAYFAATREAKADNAIQTPATPGILRVRAAYNRATQEIEELFSAKVDDEIEGLYYRIDRGDGAYDSGLKKLTHRSVEELPLQSNAFNIFTFRVFDSQNRVVSTDISTIEIAQGKYSVAGQVLPDDLCLVNTINNDTKLDPIFKKNAILPAMAKKSVEVGKTVLKGSDDELRIMVVEGPSENHSTTNKPIGLLLLTGKQITRDLLRGTGIDLTFELSESRDLTVRAYLDGTNQEFSQVFDPKPNDVPIDVLTNEVEFLEARFEAEKKEAKANNNHEVVEELDKLQKEGEGLSAKATLLSIDDITDDRFKLEDQKRRIAQRIYQITAGKKLEAAKAEYTAMKHELADLVRRLGTSKEQQQFEEQMGQAVKAVSVFGAARLTAGSAVLDENGYGSGGPRERFRILVSMLNPFGDCGFEFRNVVENASSALLSSMFSAAPSMAPRLMVVVPVGRSPRTSHQHRYRTGKEEHARTISLQRSFASYRHKVMTRFGDGGPVDYNIPEDFSPDRLAEMIRRFANGQGGSVCTFTVADPKTFERAQEDPESYNLLRVQHGGLDRVLHHPVPRPSGAAQEASATCIASSSSRSCRLTTVPTSPGLRIRSGRRILRGYGTPCGAP